MDPVSVFDAKNRLSARLDQVERGHEVVITRRGKPVARLTAVTTPDRPRSAVVELRALREVIAARGKPFTADELLELRDDGRR